MKRLAHDLPGAPMILSPTPDMDLANHENLDGRRLEVVADGLPLHGGAQLAIDTTMVSPLHSNGVARRGKGLLWRLRANARR